MQGKVEDAGILTYVKDDNAVLCFPLLRTCSDICLGCCQFPVKEQSAKGHKGRNPLDPRFYLLLYLST